MQSLKWISKKLMKEIYDQLMNKIDIIRLSQKKKHNKNFEIEEVPNSYQH